MTAPNVRTAAQAEAEFALIEAARDAAVDQGFAHGCDCGASEVNAFSWGAVWGAALVTPTREQIAGACERYLAERFTSPNHPQLEFLIEDSYGCADAVLALMQEAGN